MHHLYVFLNLACTVYAHLVVKWQVNKADADPVEFADKLKFLGGLLLNPWIWSAMLVVFLASLFWMLAMTKLDLSYAWLFLSLTFVFIPLGSHLFFGEQISAMRMASIGFIVIGVVLGGRS